MEDLRLVGVHDDGEHLLLAGSDGRRFRVPVDEPMRAAVRRDRARLGQLQIQTRGTLRPKDIQARIRAGADAEEIAEAAGLPVEHVRRYEGPVLAEREFVARQARAVRVRRPDGTDPSLGDLVGERLAARDVDDAGVSWDAWRQEDGQWVVVLEFTGGSRRRSARWVYDSGLRHVLPQDDEARWLTDEDAPEPGVPQPRRLSPVPDPLLPGGGRVLDRVYDVEADGGVRPSTMDEEGVRATVDLLDTLRERRGRRPRPGGRPATEGALAADAGPATRPEQEQPSRDPVEDVLDLGALERAGRPGAEPGHVPGQQPLPLGGAVDPVGADEEIPAAHPPRSRPDLADDAEVLALPDEDVPGEAAAAGAAPAEPARPAPPAAARHQTGRAARSTPTSAPAAAAARKNRRASVPSWDDIVFGSRRE